MKRIMIFLLISMVVLVSCKKEVPDIPPLPDVEPDVKVPVVINDEKQMSEIQTMVEAIRNQDVNLCYELSEDKKQGCLDRIIKVQAIQAGDKTMCNQIVSKQIKYECEKGVG